MLAYTYEENGKFVLKEKEKPTLQSEDDAIVRVTLESVPALAAGENVPAQAL